jgi:hypothetical protein
VTTRWQRLAGRDPRLLACLLALVVANGLTIVSDFTRVGWLMWFVVVGYVIAIASFVSRQVISYRLTAQRFPVIPASPAEPREDLST